MKRTSLEIMARMPVLVVLLFLAVPCRSQTVVNITYPGSVYSVALGINNNNVIVGAYTTSTDMRTFQGFILSGGNFSTMPAPSASAEAIFPISINDAGSVVGSYYDPTTSTGYAFLFSSSSGTYTNIGPSGSINPVAYGINNSGQIVGYYYDKGGTEHGFELTQGTYSNIDCTCGATYPQSINNAGTIVGFYVDSNNNQHGFTYNSGVFTTVDYPGAMQTLLYGINDNGTVAGFWEGASSVGAFTGSNGQYSAIPIPPPANDIGFLGINNSGQIVGEGVDFSAQFTEFGFLLSSGPFAYVTTGFNAANNLLVIDSQTGLQVSAITLPGYAVGPASTPDGKYVYVTCGTGSPGIIPSNEVCIVDVATNTLVNTIPVGNGAYGIAITPNGTTAYVANYYDSTISVINIASGVVTDTFALGPNPAGVAITPNGQFAYVTFTGGVSVVNTVNNQVETSIGPFLGAAAYGLYPNITPNGKFVYVNSNATSSPGLVTVISTATNAIVGTIDVGNNPISAAISPDSSTVYVDNLGNSTISIINTATNTVVATVPAGGIQTSGGDDFLTSDGSVLWVLNQNNIAQISTATDAVIAQLPYPNTPAGAGIFVNAPATSQSITLPLSPTAPNIFNFTSHTFTVQYPAGTNFSGVNMTVTAVPTSQATFMQRVAGTEFANATCIVYSGAGGNCVDYQVTCSATGGGTISCPSVSTPSIAVKTSFDAQQQIINPGFLTTPIGANDWTNIFYSFSLQRADPTVKGRTKGFSEFVAVDLGAGNEQGAGVLQFLWPLRTTDPRIFTAGVPIPVVFQLTSIAHPGEPVTDAKAGISVVMISDATGNATSKTVLEQSSAFDRLGDYYFDFLDTRRYVPGTYVVTVYGDAFAAQQVQFSIVPPKRLN